MRGIFVPLVAASAATTLFACAIGPEDGTKESVPDPDHDNTLTSTLAGPRPLFQLPFPCGQQWLTQTRADHIPNPNSLDMLKVGGGSSGQPILAAFAGQVVRARFESGGGNFVRIDHGNGWQTRYLHMIRTPVVTEGQRVSQGQLLGHVGSTGNSGTPHLHFEQMQDGTTVRSAFNGQLVTVGVGRSQILTSQNCGGGGNVGILNFLAGDVNGDGRVDIIHPRNDGTGRLEIQISLSTGVGYAPLSTSSNLGQGSGALAWLTGDVNADGRTDLIQPFDNAGRLGILVYASNGTGYSVLSGTPDIGQGSGALAWLTGDVNADGRTDLIQPFNNAGRLGILVYASNGAGYSVLSGTPDIGQGSGALAWLTGDVNADGRTDIIQPFNNAGRLGILVYASNGAGYSVLSGTPDIGQGSGALAWLTGDVNADRRTDLIQPFNNAGRLGILVYASNGAGYSVLSGTPDIGQGSGALAWLTGDGTTAILQPWANGTRLGLLAYTSNGVGFVNTFGSTDLGPL